MLSSLAFEEIIEIADSGDIPRHIYDLSCHNQRVERAIKLVTATSQKSVKKQKKEGIIQTVIASRKELPRSDSKKDFIMKIKLNKPKTVKKKFM